MIHFKKIFSVMLAFALIFSFATQSFAAGKITTEIKDDGRVQVIMEFKDSEEAKWAFEYIAKMQAKKVFTGYDDGTFRPNKPVNRAEAIVTAVRVMGLEEEAKEAQLEDVQLHFKDAKLLDNKYSWAKGYVIVALENGLFDASEEKIQPDKPASRIWASSLLVRALGLEEEALTMMTDIPEFKDAAEIPAGAIGYVNVALEKELITGYHDQTFKPNKNVTRAEMAALLNRTNDAILEENGASTVMGTITDIELDEETAIEEEEVVEQTIGSITVETYNGLSQTYEIASDIYVEYEESFLTFNQLKVGDKVSLVVNEGVVVEAALVTEEVAIEEIDGIIEFKLEVELSDDEEYEYKYKNDDGEIKAKIEEKTEDSKLELSGEEAQTQLEDLLKELELTSDMSKEEAVSLILEALELDQADIKEFELEVKFADGTKLKIELEQDDDDEDDHDDEEDEDQEDDEEDEE